MSTGTIWKEILWNTAPGDTTFFWPEGSRALSVGMDPQGQPCLWYYVPDTQAPKVQQRVHVAWTGWEVPAGWRHVGTVTHGDLVLHVWVP